MEPRLRIVVRPYGSPIPLGFFAFGIGMFMYAALDVGWVKAADQLKDTGIRIAMGTSTTMAERQKYRELGVTIFQATP